MPVQRVTIIGGGITGVTAALALTRHNAMSCAVFEIRSEPATIGGAIGLTPKALRYLDHLGVLSRLQSMGCEVKSIDIMCHRTGKNIGAIDFDNIERFKHLGIRVMRHQLLEAMLATLRGHGVEVQYGKKIISIAEDHDSITATFEDGTEIKGDVLLGCDGIHSAIQTKFIQPDRQPEYTGIATAYGFTDATSLSSQLPIDSTSLYFSRLGSLLLAYTDPAKSRLYAAAVMRAPDVGSREGWIVKGQEQKALKADLLRRFSTPTLPWMEEALQELQDITLYPVHRLSEDGLWSSGRTLLLGDAAHAMPPQG
ncbi:FAD/NAD(P)-binding domain-containing protein [Lentithecium fluviatile CBS 122367]|uniref:FAD/NAD(P)-binding domain-containing protein n=1 Tax=Lentithecium fluviatile CBS 122367 TaxID=1168545 RepID=A0A6G1IKQ6_9PLEO|nr:FAD/NAD(P)-binding domain-containing protein [Lentithecium fluviatile CBS 122367]